MLNNLVPELRVRPNPANQSPPRRQIVYKEKEAIRIIIIKYHYISLINLQVQQQQFRH